MNNRSAKNKILVIVQGRMGSIRFPGKTMSRICDSTVIELLLFRLGLSKAINKIIVATPASKKNDSLAQHVKALGVEVYQGDENDVLDRFYQAAKVYLPEVIVRITADCPIIDPTITDQVVSAYLREKVDYASNTNPATFPDGLDVEVFSFDTLEKAWIGATKPHEREHVSLYMKESGKFKTFNVCSIKNYSDQRWTLDELDDYRVITRIFEHFYPRKDFSWLEVIELSKAKPELFEDNKHIIRNEGMTLNADEKLQRQQRSV